MSTLYVVGNDVELLNALHPFGAIILNKPEQIPNGSRVEAVVIDEGIFSSPGQQDRLNVPYSNDL